MVLVSVLLTSYNHKLYISEAIESVLNQTFKNFEFLIIDDYSTDNSQQIIKKFKEKDQRIKIYFHSKNKGIAVTQNELINMAKGKYVAFLNSDDIWFEDKLAKQIEILEKDDNLIIWSEGEIIDKNSRLTGKRFTKNFNAFEKKKSGYIFKAIFSGTYIFFSTLILKKEHLNNIKFSPRLKITSDYLFEVLLAKDYNFYFISEPLAKYRIHDKNTFYSNDDVFNEEILLCRLYLLRKYSDIVEKHIKWVQYIGIINNYINLGKKMKAKSFLYKIYQIYPFKLLNFRILTKTFLNPIIYTYLNISFIKIANILKKKTFI